MRVFESLHTVGALVRVPSGRHGQVESFDSHTNQVTLAFADGLSDEQVHILVLRAGNNDSEIAFRGKATTTFPKVFPLELQEEGQARRQKLPSFGELMGMTDRYRPLS